MNLNAFQLKLIAVIFMIIDHIYSYLFIGIWPAWVSLLARFVALLFVYFLVEGFHHTRSKRKYATRLGIAAIIMWLGNIVINFSFNYVDPLTNQMTLYSLLEGHNIFMTLFLLFLVMWCTDLGIKKRKIAYYFLAVLPALFSLAMEGGIYLLPVLFIFYGFYQNKNKQMLVMAIYCLFLLLQACYTYFSGASGISLYQTLCFKAEFMMIAVIPLLYGYHGQLGKKSRLRKNFFYLIYPLHLWLLMIVSYCLR